MSGAAPRGGEAGASIASYGYAVAGVLGVRLARAAPGRLAMALAAPAIPWVLWLFPSSIAEAGLRALLWPGLAVVVGGTAWLGGNLAARPGSTPR
jgi:hypothetical protein